MKNYLKAFAFMILATVAGCKNDDEEPAAGKAELKIYMTDAPGPYDSVLIDIQSVAVTGPAANEVFLNITPGIYNLLDFTNGVDTLLATGTIDAGTVSQIRLILGNNNRVVVGGVSYPLSTPSAQQSGLKLQIHKTFLAGITYDLLLDFDAYQSIVEHGNGTYSLKPVIRVVETPVSGSIKGTILPAVNCQVAANMGGSSYTTFCAPDGRFLIQGLPAGNYTVVFNPAPPLPVDSVMNVNVTVGNVTDMGLVPL
jgi:hypothetical protein